MSARIRAGILPAALCLFASCTSFTEPEISPVDGFVDGPFQVTLSVDPSRVLRPASVVARLTYENLGSEPVDLGSSYTCVSFASVFQGMERVTFRATDYGCGAAGLSRRIEGHGELMVEWPLTLTTGHAAGVYRFVAMLTTHARDPEGMHARELEATFSVR